MRHSISCINIYDLIVIDGAVHHIFQGMYALGSLGGYAFPCDMGSLGLVTICPNDSDTMYTYLCKDPAEMSEICATLTREPTEQIMRDLVEERRRKINYCLITTHKLIEGAKAEVQMELIHIRFNQLLQTTGSSVPNGGFHRYEILLDVVRGGEHRGNKWFAAQLNYF